MLYGGVVQSFAGLTDGKKGSSIARRKEQTGKREGWAMLDGEIDTEEVVEVVEVVEIERRWLQLSETVISGMAEWRAAHPRATLREIEEALDERLERLRAQMLQDTALTSPAADWAGLPKSQRPLCPQCGTPLQARGKQSRKMHTFGGQQVNLVRTYGVCPTCNGGLFPPR